MNVKLAKLILQTVYPSYMQKNHAESQSNLEVLCTNTFKNFYSHGT